MSAGAAEIEAEGLDRLSSADIVLIGEVHDNPAHHENQARAVAALRPAAIVFEMLTDAQAARTPRDRTDAERLARLYDWQARGWPDFADYHPIFLAAPRAEIRGGDPGTAEVRRAVTEGAATVFGADAARFGLTKPLDPLDQQAREREMDEAHCGALPAELLSGMVEAQRLRDAALARAVVDAMAETGGPVAVITGNGHARRDIGVPAVLAQAAPELRVLSIGQIEGNAGGTQPYDHWIVTGTVDRGDPCAAFGTETRLDRGAAETVPG